MTKYSAETRAKIGERTINQASVNIRKFLWELQGRNMSHRPNDDKIIERTNSRKHYRVPLDLVVCMNLITVSPPGLPETEPPTTLVKVGDMVVGMEMYAEKVGGISKIIESLRNTDILK